MSIRLIKLFLVILTWTMVSCSNTNSRSRIPEADRFRSSSSSSTTTGVGMEIGWKRKDRKTKGFFLYYGLAPRTYFPKIDVGNVTTYKLYGLMPNTRYYFTVTAYDDRGRETRFSNEMSRKTY